MKRLVFAVDITSGDWLLQVAVGQTQTPNDCSDRKQMLVAQRARSAQGRPSGRRPHGSADL